MKGQLNEVEWSRLFLLEQIKLRLNERRNKKERKKVDGRTEASITRKH